MRRAFVIGYPIAHSRSPMIHGHWLAKLGIAGSYQRIAVAPDRLASFVRDLPESGFVGGNVTIPHKEAILPLVDRLDEPARIIGAANTLWLADGKVHATNTDALGYAADLDRRAPRWCEAKVALVLGAGGAACAVIHALLESTSADVRVINRTVGKARELADRFGPRVSAYGFEGVDELSTDADIVVNTTSVGMNGEGGALIDVTRLPGRAIVSDIVYTPLATPLLKAAAGRGLVAVDGLGMLLHQAVPGFERWFGARPQVTEELRSLIVADIEGRR